MFKPMMMTALMSAMAAPALADVPPAPPTEVYVEPVSQNCEPVTIRLYFQNGEAMLSSHARSVIEEAKTQLEGCSILEVDMVALTGDGRSLSEAEMIGGERLEIVSALLREDGLLPVPASARIVADGEATLILARRVDVTLAAYDPQIG